MATTTEELKINITVNSDDAESKLESLRSKITEIASLSEKGNFQHLGDLAKSLKSIAGSSEKLSSVAGHIKAITAQADALGKTLAGIKDNKDAFSGMSKSLKGMKSAIGDAEEVSSKSAGIFGAMGASGANSFRITADNIVSGFKRIGSAGAQVAQIPFKMLFSPMQGLATRVTGLAGSFGHLFRTIGRVAFMRAIRGAIRLATKSIGEGITNVYSWANAVGNSFVNTMNTIATSFNYLKNSIGAAFSPLFDAIAPVLDAIIDKCVEVINVFNQLIATLTGASTWRKAEKTTTAFGGATNNAAKGANNANKAAKELKRTLLGFDEINRLDDQDSGSGGGGGGGGGGGKAGAGALSFSEQPIDNSISDFADKLKEAWKKADFTEIGSMIGDKIGTALLNVPWETKIQPGVYKVSKSLGTLLTGMLSYNSSGGKKLWDGVGYTVYNGINTGLIGYTTFFKWTDFEGIGEGIGSALVQALTHINWTDGDTSVAAALAAFPNAVIDAVKGFMKKFYPQQFYDVGHKIGEAIAKAIIRIKWKDFFNDVTGMAERLLAAINGAFEGFGAKWGAITRGIVSGIKRIPKTRWNSLGNQLGRLVFNAADFIVNVIKVLVKALEAADWNEIWTGFKNGLGKANWGKIGDNIVDFMEHHLGTLMILFDLMMLKPMIKGLTSTLIGGAFASAAPKLFSFSGGALTLTIATAVAFAITKINTPKVQKELDEGVKNNNQAELDQANQYLDALDLNKQDQTKRIVKSTDIPHVKKTPAPKEPVKIPTPNLNPGAVASQASSPFKSESLFDNITLPKIPPIKLTADVTKVNDRLTQRDKTFGNGTLTVQQAIDNIKNGDKSTKNWTAIYDYFKGKGVKGTTIPNFIADYAKKIGNGVKAFTLKNNTAQYDHRTGAATKKFTLPKNTAQFDYKTILFKIGQIAGFTAGIDSKKLPSFSDLAFWFIKGFTAVFTKSKNETGNGQGATGGIYKNGRWQPVQRYASGGLIGTSGQMFIAREAGPELVGTIGGNTAILNNDQIVASVSAGVARAVSQVLGGQGDNPIEVVVKVDSEVLYRSVQKGERKANGRYGTAVAIG